MAESGDSGGASVADRIKALQRKSQRVLIPPGDGDGGGGGGGGGGPVTARKAGSGVAARIAAMQRQQQQAACAIEGKSSPGDDMGGEGGAERKKVAALAGSLAGQLNMNAMLGGGGLPPSLQKRPSKTAVEAGGEAEAKAVASSTKGEGRDGTITHVTRPIISAGRRRRRGHRAFPGGDASEEEKGSTA